MLTLFKAPTQNSHRWCNEPVLENGRISIYFKVWPGTTYMSQSSLTKYIPGNPIINYWGGKETMSNIGSEGPSEKHSRTVKSFQPVLQEMEYIL